MSVYLSPLGNDQQLDSNGNPLVGGYWEVYAAGTTTPVTTYTSNSGVTPQPSQILLDASGRPANPIWLTGGAPVKFRLSSAAAVVLLTIDNVSGINDPSGSAVAPSEWIASGFTPTYLSATSFSVAGDQTGTFQVGRRVRTTNTGGTVYSTIVTSVYGALTTVTVVNDSGVLDSGLSVVSVGILSITNPSATAYVGSSLVLIQSQSASASAQIDFTSGITSTYSEYVLKMIDVVPATNGVNLSLRVSEDGGATFKAGASDYAYTLVLTTDAGAPANTGSTGQTLILLASSLSSTKSYSGEVTFYVPSGASRHKLFRSSSVYEPSAATITQGTGTGAYIATNNAINAVRFLMSAGNITSGTFLLYGVRKS